MNNLVIEFINFIKHQKQYSEHTIINYENDLYDFLAFLEKETINDLKDVDYIVIRHYLMELYKAKFMRKSISRKLSSLRTFFNYLIKQDYLYNNPLMLISSPKKEKKLPTFLYGNELDKIFETIDITTPLGIRNYLIVELLYSTGLRVSELCNIKLNDIDYYNQTILIVGKGNKERLVVFGEYAFNSLNDYLENSREVLMLKNKDDNSNYLLLNNLGKPITSRGVRLIIENIVKEAWINTHVTPHVLRHTFATHLLNEGCDLRTVQELLGHSHLSSTQIYTHVTTQQMRDVYLSAHPREKNKVK